MAGNGANVVINFATNQSQANEVVSEVILSEGQAFAIQADISQSAEITKLFDQAIEKYGKIDIVVNNGGIMITKFLKDTTGRLLQPSKTRLAIGGHTHRRITKSVD